MSPKPIVMALVSSSIVLAAASTQAQVTVDVSKVTCDQYVHTKIAIEFGMYKTNGRVISFGLK